MRLGFSLVVILSVLAVGCSGKGKKSESAPAPTKADATASGKKAEMKSTEKSAAAAPAAAGDKVTCETKGDSRVLEVRAKDKGCELAYTKGGTETVVASSQNGKGHCTTTLEKIKGRLEAAGFACK